MPKSKPKKSKSAPRSKSKPYAKRAATKRAVAPAALQYIPWHTIPLEDLNPLLKRQFVVGQEIMLARVLLDKGCIVPEHSHHNEQLTYIVEGALKFWIDGKEIVVHAGEALEYTVDLDIFTPPRADWINKTDQYLRKDKK
jgi:mannose-6-phosphate isomerase-like protein (cupin superfamily)